MANTHSNLTSLFTAIAGAIRTKTGSTDTIVADQFPDAIAGINAAPKVGTITTGSSATASQTIADLIGCNGFVLCCYGTNNTDSSYTTGIIVSVYYDGETAKCCYCSSGSTSSYIDQHLASATFNATTGVVSVGTGRFGKSWTYQYIYW